MSLAVQIHNSLMFSFIRKNAWQEVVDSSVILKEMQAVTVSTVAVAYHPNHTEQLRDVEYK